MPRRNLAYEGSGSMKLVILDRDGTLNVPGDEVITAPEDWRPLPGALEALARLNHAGWHVVVASNQPGLGRGLFDVVALNAIHARMQRQVAAVGGRIDAVFFCPHAPDEACACRLPAPGLLEQITERYGLEPGDVCVVGSSPDLLQAALALGAQAHALAPAPGVPPVATPDGPRDMPRHASLAAFVQALLRESGSPAVAAALPGAIE